MNPAELASAAANSQTPSAASQPVARLYGEPMLEYPKDLYIPPDALEVFLERFEGPLDLLLYLWRCLQSSIWPMLNLFGALT